MKHLLTAFVFAFGMAFYAPAVHADCGSCGGEDKGHSHEGHKHGDAKCDGCDKAKADCDCKKKDDALCKCGKTKAECECKKGEE